MSGWAIAFFVLLAIIVGCGVLFWYWIVAPWSSTRTERFPMRRYKPDVPLVLAVPLWLKWYYTLEEIKKLYPGAIVVWEEHL